MGTDMRASPYGTPILGFPSRRALAEPKSRALFPARNRLEAERFIDVHTMRIGLVTLKVEKVDKRLSARGPHETCFMGYR